MSLVWRSTHRRWKQAVEAAISPVWHLNERDRLAAAVAKRIWLEHGGRPGADARVEGTLLMLEAMVSRHLSDDVVRASLGLRYLEALAVNVCRADYEDVGILLEEAQWVERYLERQVRCPLLGRLREEPVEALPDQAAARRERLYEALIRVSAAELRSAGAVA